MTIKLPTNGPHVVSLGVGWDSAALLVLFKREGIRPDLIVFADVGAEKPETYKSIRVLHQWCLANGFPGITIVRYEPQRSPYSTLTGNCLANDTLPGLAFGPSTCSIKWKHEPIDRYVLNWEPAKRALAEGKRVIRTIGYDDSPADRKRFARWAKREAQREKDGKGETRWEFWYPLQSVFGLTRPDLGDILRKELGREFQAAIDKPILPKSACFFCPAAQRCEVEDLAREHPDLALQAAAIEFRAETGKHGLLKVNGLGLTRRKADKGEHDTKSKNWSWHRHLVSEGLLPEHWKELAVRAGYLPADWGRYANKVTALREEIAEAEAAGDKVRAAAVKRAKKATYAPDWREYQEPDPEHWEEIQAAVAEEYTGPEFCHPEYGA